MRILLFCSKCYIVTQGPNFAKCTFAYGKGVAFIREIGTTTEIYGEIKGLPDGVYEFHVHNPLSPGNDCSIAGDHFDPDKVGNH